MAPSGRIRRTTRPTRRQPRRNHFKKRLPHSKTNQEAIIISRNLPSSNSSSTTISDDIEIPSSGCCTPKAQRFRIPEISTCPPAPKKQRLVSNCSLQRSPIAFFAPPDLELFFFFALQDISV
ncbi:cyclin-dependent protein kinase inhibitor SMR9-like [Corylus avellana]|uniref:cyclin-dependent protein kinase inhibitor SMR9-like n=1 Tax=Corylus avellana TaxID=13451 RepID=UPI001E210058|nr:cyclin-dependent protein kinase inhibitor SMR9-like [Corylus avellana]